MVVFHGLWVFAVLCGSWVSLVVRRSWVNFGVAKLWWLGCNGWAIEGFAI